MSSGRSFHTEEPKHKALDQLWVSVEDLRVSGIITLEQISRDAAQI